MEGLENHEALQLQVGLFYHKSLEELYFEDLYYTNSFLAGIYGMECKSTIICVTHSFVHLKSFKIKKIAFLLSLIRHMLL